MKRTFTFKLIALAILTVAFTACNKYEEGSNFSLISKKSRVANTWKISSITANGTDITSLSSVSQIEATKDGAYNVTYTVLGVSTTDNGAWEFNDDKTMLKITNENGQVTESTIIMLKKDEMKLSREELGTTYITHMETK